MAELKTIRVPKDTFEDAKARKEEHGVTWEQYVDPHSWHSVFDEPKSAGDALVKSDATEEIEELLAEQKNLTYDDVKQACAAAIREELPTERMGR